MNHLTGLGHRRIVYLDGRAAAAASMVASAELPDAVFVFNDRCALGGWMSS